MNDEFLTRYRKPPRREFSAALYERIQKPMHTKQNFTLSRSALAAAFCIAILGTLFISPKVRASVLHLFREIGGVIFLETDQSAAVINEESPVVETTVSEDILSLDEAREKVPFEISLPDWTPDGFSMGSQVRILYFSETYTPAYISWHGSDETLGNIDLIVGQPVDWEVDLDSLQEVQINGEPAGLTGGSWNYDTGEWSGNDATLTWIHDDVMYVLRSRAASVQDLIRMAESIP